MDIFGLTRALIDIESITGREKQVGSFLFDCLSELAARGGKLERMEVEADRFNVFACWGEPLVTLSTHMDTVPPFIASREDADYIWGRGACDAKGIIAAMTMAAKALLDEGRHNFGLLFVAGEERNSAGAYMAARHPRGSRYLINGEPTDNRLAIGTKGALRYEVVARGCMAHSAYPELGDSAIDKLLDFLQEIRRVPLTEDPVLGRATLNIGTIQGGRAPNVIPDEARAEIMIRLVSDPGPLRTAIEAAAAGRVETREVLMIPAIQLDTLPGMATQVVAFATDIPAFAGTWGRPLLIGPGSIHVAHTLEERVSKRELVEAVELYKTMVVRLLDILLKGNS